ncbi:hypothetical protein [Vibrio metschnikovii]|uniref:hypothetical protein n=1 Tax=Vibrio metschnikovii TaxID=28172 RepID=UPI001C30A595|nr:hypothetical protein [Vibrio metschnikovii]MDA3137373.1 hypothetical protein [Vibrio metschnikovii]
MKKLLSWFFGINFLFIGLSVSFDTSVIGGLLFLIIAFLTIPTSRAWLTTTSKGFVTNKTMIVVSLICFLTAGLLINKEEELKAQKQQEQKERLIAFTEKRETIIEELKQAMATNDYTHALSITERYSDIKDKELIEFNNNATNQLKTQELLAKVKPIPASDFEQNLKLYEQLLELNPNDQTFKDKVRLYKQQQQQAIRESNRLTQIKQQFSSWNGSHRNLVSHIKRQMNDPSSFEHVETVYWDKGNHLIVRTTFRGKNAFGGVVLNSVTAKVSLDGKVLEIIN